MKIDCSFLPTIVLYSLGPTSQLAIINGISHWNTGSWFTLSLVLALSNTHITYLTIFLAAESLTLEQEVAFSHPVRWGKFGSAIHMLLNHTKSSQQNLQRWDYDPSSPKHSSFHFASSSKVLWSCRETVGLEPGQEHFGFCVHLQPLPTCSAFSTPVFLVLTYYACH